MNGKTIRLFLVDGVPNGILTAEIPRVNDDHSSSAEKPAGRVR